MKDLFSRKKELICNKNTKNKFMKSKQLYKARLKILKKIMNRKSHN